MVVAGEEAAERFARQLLAYLPHEAVLRYPERADLPWADTAPDPAVVGARARALWSLAKGREAVVVASARALLRRVPPRDAQAFEPLTLAAGAALDLSAATERLARMGYERVDAAEEPAQFAVRGGVLDVFAAGETAPVRAELFGDEIETLRRYLPSTGQTLADAPPTEVYPCREVVLGTRAVGNVERALGDSPDTDETLAHDLERMRAGVYFNGVERYLPLMYREPGAPTDYVHPSALVVVAEPRSLFDDAVRATEAVAAAAKATDLAAPVGAPKVRTAGLFLTPAQLDLGGARRRLTFLSLMRAGGSVDAELQVRRPDVAGGPERLAGALRALLDAARDVGLNAEDL
ncbi:transcription-repair coupling factor, partial [bacterium]